MYSIVFLGPPHSPAAGGLHDLHRPPGVTQPQPVGQQSAQGALKNFGEVNDSGIQLAFFLPAVTSPTWGCSPSTPSFSSFWL